VTVKKNGTMESTSLGLKSKQVECGLFTVTLWKLNVGVRWTTSREVRVKFHPGQIFATYCKEPILTGAVIRREDIWLSILAMINPERLKALDRLDCS